MHEFKYRGNNLYCESIRVSNVAKDINTPFYLYSHKTLLMHYHKLRKAFQCVNPLICFSMKANSNLAVLKTLVNEGAGLDIVSGGELYRAKRCGVSPEKIVYASVGKTAEEIKAAIKANILLFNIESVPELELINELAGKLARQAHISIRLNPDINPKTHKYIKTARAENKFGLDLSTARKIFLNKDKFSNLEIVGVHIHIGSQITESKPFVDAIRKTVSFIENLKGRGIAIEWFNIGGGLGIVYREERPQTAKEFARAILPLLKKLSLKIILEPGRFIAGNSGILVTRVIYVKETAGKRFIIVDAGMNDLIRPSLYGGYHEIVPLIRNPSHLRRMGRVARRKADVVGPVCESADFLAKDRKLPEVSRGDLLAVMGTGAYGFTMSSNYNSRPRCPEVLVIKNKFYVVRAREDYRDLIRGENIPKELKT